MSSFHRRAGACGLLFLLAGCVHTTPQWDAHFGDAARLAMAQQVLHPQAVFNADPVAGMDGKAARATFERYQKSSTEPPPPPAQLTIRN
jgi:hypothetical protein